jgi:hypothetical protein
MVARGGIAMSQSQMTSRAHPRVHSNPITTTTTVADAGFELLASRSSAAVVYRKGHPFGVVTVGDLAGHHGRVPLPEALVGDVMSLECVRVGPGAGVDETLRAYREAAWDSVRRRRPCGQETVRRQAGSFLVFEPNRMDRRPS